MRGHPLASFSVCHACNKTLCPGERPVGREQVHGCNPSGARPTRAHHPQDGRTFNVGAAATDNTRSMVSRSSKRRAVLIGAMLSAVIGGTVQPATASPVRDAGDQATAFRSSPVRSTEQEIARALSASLRDPQWREQVRAAVLGTEDVDLQALAGRTAAQRGRNLFASVAAADRHIAVLKGLPASTGSLRRVRLGAPSMRSHLKA
jgi:hypothetical protein